MALSLILLEIKNAPGDSTVVGYEDHMTVDSFSWSLSAKTEEKLTDDPVTKVDVKAVSINKAFDRASTVLRKMMDEDKPFDATLRFIDPTSRSQSRDLGRYEWALGKPDSVFEIQLQGCHIDSINFSAGEDKAEVKISERLTISYETSATLTYRRYDRKTKTRGQSRGSVMTAEIPPSDKGKTKT